MATAKHVLDLVTKVSRLNKDRMIANDLTELLRALKGLDKDMMDLTLMRQSLMLENARLKRELLVLKKDPRMGAPPQQDAPVQPVERVAADFVWKPETKS